MNTLQLQPVKAINHSIRKAENPLMEVSTGISPVLTLPKEETAIRHPKFPFIEANTKEVTMEHLRQDCVVPVFSKDNEITISHPAFIETIWEAAQHLFPCERMEAPAIRVSHVVKGRTPEAIHKPVKDLLEEDKTIYYERMMFCFEIPSIHEDIAGNRLNLTIGGVRAYNHENLYSRKSPEKFKVFIGYKNMVCCNMCVSTDGYKVELKAQTTHDLFLLALELFQHYSMAKHLSRMEALQDSHLTAHQFAQFIGKCRLYQYLPTEQKRMLPPLLMTDTQIGMVAKAYYCDEHFHGNGRIFPQSDEENAISLWRVYNLLTGANKSSYIDNFLDRSLNASQLAEGLDKAVHGEGDFGWFIQ